MKAITIHQPYAQYIADGVKQYETRSWSTNYRGLVAIHAGKTWDRDLKEQAISLSQRYATLPNIGDSPQLGSILAIALLEAVIPTKKIRETIDKTEAAIGGYADGRFAWRLKIIERFDIPIPASGQQGLWHWDWDGVDTSKRIAIVGSRKYADLSLVKDYVYSLPLDTVIISGGAQGVDLAGETHARERGMTVISIPVDTRNLPQQYEKRKQEYGRRAKVRNTYIVEMAGSVTAFWDEASRGTKDSIDKAKNLGRDVVINPMSKAIQAELVQKELIGFSSVYDEGAYIEKSNTSADSSPDIDLYEWDKPWRINEHWVWVFAGWVEGERTYCPARIDSDEARLQQRNLGGFFHYSQTVELRDWMDKQIGWVATPNYHQKWDVDDLPRQFVYNKDYSTTRVSALLTDIQPTQATVHMPIVRRYIRKLSIKDDNGNLPLGIQFTDTKILLINGHHRYASLWWANDKRMSIEVEKIPLTLSQAHGLIDDEDELAVAEIARDLIAEAIAILQGEKEYA